MSSEERRQILQMLEDGKITAAQALVLMKELDEDAGPELGPKAGFSQASASGPAPEVIPGYPASSAPELEETAERVRSLWQIPLWIGVTVTVFSAWGMYTAMRSAGYNFWFYCLWLPFLFGIAVMALAAWSRTARWLFVNVQPAPGSGGPKRIFLGFPLPLGLAGWFLRVFGRWIDGLKGTNADDVAAMVTVAQSMKEPLIVNVNDSDDGERVQVYIG